ncbi:MAG: V-type ATP synthase subunit E family protein [Dehalococcoidales bacterium]|nr:V-type ATP synthase subunit E family protein [Dehalococcoidales bacterium]
MQEEMKNLEILSAEILGRARREAEEIRQSAQREADAALERTREDLEAEEVRRVDAATRENQAYVRRATSTAEVEGQRLLLQQRESLIDRVLEAAWQRVANLADKGQRQASLVELGADAVAALGGGDVELRVSDADRPLLDAALLAKIVEVLDRRRVQAKLTVADHPEPIAGGVVAAKEGGRIVLNNSFEARFARERDALRPVIWHVLSGKRRRRTAA